MDESCHKCSGGEIPQYEEINRLHTANCSLTHYGIPSGKEDETEARISIIEGFADREEKGRKVFFSFQKNYHFW